MRRSAALPVILLLASACSGPASGPRPEFVREGAEAPRLELPELIGAPVKALKGIETLNGKVVVLEFWATWCGPCAESIPRLNALAEKFRDKPVVFISITDEPREDVEDFLKRTPIKGWIAPGADAAVFRAYRVFGRPHTVLIGRDSRVAAVTEPSQVTSERLQLLLAGQVPASSPPQGLSTSAVPGAAEFFLGDPVNGEITAEYGRNFYAGHNTPLLPALEYFYREAARIEASTEVRSVLSKRRELRVRLPEERAGELRGFFAEGIMASLGLRPGLVRKNSQVYLLRPAHSGIRGFKRSSPGEGTARSEGAVFRAERMPAGALCGLLKEKLGAPVLDETGLKGEYDYSFETGAGDLAGLNNALISQLGLRLMPSNRRITVLEVR